MSLECNLQALEKVPSRQKPIVCVAGIKSW